MKVLNYIFVVFSLSCMLSCATDIVDMTGSIVGTVKDASSNTGIEGCLVTLTPSNLSKTTNSAGQVSFEDLDAGTYSLAFAKDGYESLTKDLPVTAGKNTSVEILLKPTLQEISVNPASLNFGDLETTKELYLSKSGGNDTQFSIKANQKWMSVSPESGILGKTNVKIAVVVNRNELSAGEYQGTITITSSFGETFVPVFMSKVESSAPQVSIGASCYEVTENSFKIDGIILHTGGNEITSYGHCWSKNENPTIADSKTNFGNTKEIGEYTSQINQGIIAGETYYVRAYAVNKVGESYSNAIRITIPKITTPTVVTLAAKDITKTSAVINGSIADTGNGEITECGFYYGKTSNPTTKISTSIITSFSYNLSQLEEGTTYYYKAYAKNAKGESCGEVLSFTTSREASALGVATGNATNIAYSSATLNASIWGEFKGSKEIYSCGFYIGTNQYQMQAHNVQTITDNNFDLTIKGLSPETKYYYYAYVRCYDNTLLKGDIQTFTTVLNPKITYIKYTCSKTVDDELWLNLEATIAPAGLKLIDAGFLMGNVKDGDSLHSSYNQITIVPCDFQDDTVKYDDIAKDYLTWTKRGTYIKPYFVFEDGTEIYGKTKYLENGSKIEEQY